ncbi:hypothetical protein AGMMS50229_05070 [Campylobacterota bacterium]|nr:hypothetical protein AGMMS50229_05070 [Campylobacterota bacterium]
MDWIVIKGYTYFFVMFIATILLVWYIWYLYINKARREHYEEYSDLVLKDGLDDAPLEAMENTKKDEK